MTQAESPPPRPTLSVCPSVCTHAATDGRETLSVASSVPHCSVQRVQRVLQGPLWATHAPTLRYCHDPQGPRLSQILYFSSLSDIPVPAMSGHKCQATPPPRPTSCLQLVVCYPERSKLTRKKTRVDGGVSGPLYTRDRTDHVVGDLILRAVCFCVGCM